MRAAASYTPILLMCALCMVRQDAHAEPKPVCVDIEKRAEFEPSLVIQDVADVDSDPVGKISEEEFRKYLLACDSKVRKQADPSKQLLAISDALHEAITHSDDQCRSAKCEFGQRPRGLIQAYAVARARLSFKAPEPQKPDEVAPKFTVGRSILDLVSPLSKNAVAKGPFLVSFKRDYAKREDSGLLLGKLSYGPWFFGDDDGWDVNVSAGFDVNTGKDPEESSITFSGVANYHKDLDKGALVLSVSPEYGTDGNGDRDVVSIKAQLGLFGERFSGAGQWKDLGNGHFSWDPSITAYCGDVRDDGGNANLEKIRQQGSYCRVQPAIEARWRTERFAQYALGLRAGYGQTYDLRHDWDRGFGEIEATLGVKDSPLQMILLYRKGRKAPTFEEERALILGVGIQL